MSYTLLFTDSYKKRANRFARQHPELKEQYRKTLLLLARKPYRKRSTRTHTQGLANTFFSDRTQAGKNYCYDGKVRYHR